MKELASEMGSSHQNIKQVALNLQQKGLLKLEKNKNDAGVAKLRLAGRSYDFWKETDPKDSVFRENMFKVMDKKDIATTRALLEIMLLNLTEIENVVIEEAENA